MESEARRTDDQATSTEIAALSQRTERAVTGLRQDLEAEHRRTASQFLMTYVAILVSDAIGGVSVYLASQG